MSRTALCIAVLVVCAGISSVTATTYYVDGAGGSDAYDGLAAAWDGAHGPKQTIQAGIDAATDTDEVSIAPGTYAGDGNRNLDFAHGLPTGQTRAITVRGTNPDDPAVVAATVIDCQNSPGQASGGFTFQTGEGENSVLAGLTIVNASGNGGIISNASSPTIRDCVIRDCFSSSEGGGISCQGGSSPTISRCTFDGNTAAYGGALAGSLGDSPTLIDCTVTHNSAGESGGGFYFNTADSPTITGCVFIANSSGMGGGVCGMGCAGATVQDCRFEANIASGDGGGIYWTDDSTTIEHCTLINNAARLGGGVYVAGSAQTIQDCTIIGNTASWGGGVMTQYASTTIANCVISQNSAGQYGGGIDGAGNTIPGIINCVIQGNQSQKGGGIACQSRNAPTLVNCTITDNYGFLDGGAIHLERPDYAIVANCILWNNASPAGPQISLISGSMNVSFCDVQGGQAATYIAAGSTLKWGQGNIDADPLLAFPNDYHLMFGSPCVDTGTSAPAGKPAALPATDIEGNTRPLDGNADGVAAPDIGAHEHTGAESPEIAVSPQTLTLVWNDDEATAADATLSIRNVGNAMLNWAVTADCAWLVVLPSTGESAAGQTEQIVLRVNGAALPVGVASSLVTVSDQPGTTPPRQVWVTLRRTGSVLRVPSQYPRIQDAINAAADVAVVWVADGTYTGGGNRNLDYLGKAITVRSENGPDRCIIDCQNAGRGFYFHNAEGASSVVDGFTIVHGTGDYGGGVRCESGGPTIRNCIFRNNTATICGGGIYGAPNTALTISNCLITDCSSDKGGGIYSWSGSRPTITNCTLVRNTATTAGGGMRSYGGFLTFRNCIFWGNTSPAGHELSMAGSGRASIFYSDFQGGQAAVSLETGGTVTWGGGSINLDPRFVSPNGPDGDPATWQDNDYRLAFNSPCIDTGDPAADYTGQTDVAGEPRRTYLRADMGAYEFAWRGPLDFDDDADVDLLDFAFFRDCFNGPNRPPHDAVLCLQADVNGDNDVDLEDFFKFRMCFNDSNRPPSCASQE